MVGHTGIFDAAKQAVEAVDTCVGRMVDAILAKGGVALITADHGNADKMCEPDGTPFTAHTTTQYRLSLLAKTASCGTAAFWRTSLRQCCKYLACHSRKK